MYKRCINENGGETWINRMCHSNSDVFRSVEVTSHPMQNQNVNVNE